MVFDNEGNEILIGMNVYGVENEIDYDVKGIVEEIFEEDSFGWTSIKIKNYVGKRNSKFYKIVL